MMYNNISVIILCYNEEIHIERALNSALSLTPEVFIIDSHSTDNTIKIASEYPVKIMQFDWNENSTLSDKLNFAIRTCNFKTEWILRLDSDEYLMPGFNEIINKKLPQITSDIKGIKITRNIFFMGKHLKYGKNSYSEVRIIKSKGILCENRLLDEHFIIEKEQITNLDLNIADDNLKDLDSFILKHINYSSKEAIEIINKNLNILDNNATNSFYYKMPSFWRCILLFFQKYILHLGFIDGKYGFIYIFLQCLWYRILCDAKVEEIYKICGKNKYKIQMYLKHKYKINFQNET